MAKLYSGRNLGLFVGKETAFSTAVTPTACLKQTGFQAKWNKEFIESKSKTGSRAVDSNVPVAASGSLTVPFEADPENLGYLLKAAMGSEAVAVVVSAKEWKHTFSMLDASNLPSFTFIGQIGGFKAFRYRGSTNSQLSLDMSPKSIISGSAEFVFVAEDDLAKSFASTAISATTGQITLASHGFADGDRVKFVQSDTLPAGLSADTVYFVVSSAAGAFSLALTESGSAVVPTTQGSGTHRIQPWSMLAATAAKPLTYIGASITVDAVAFGEVRNGSIQIANNPFLEDYRFNNNGELASVPVQGFGFSGKLQVVFNEAGIAMRDRYLAGTECAVQITLSSAENIASGAGKYKLVINIPRCQLSSGDPNPEDSGVMMDMEFKSLGSGVTFDLHNGQAAVY
jgi:hypothetical protein